MGFSPWRVIHEARWGRLVSLVGCARFTHFAPPGQGQIKNLMGLVFWVSTMRGSREGSLIKGTICFALGPHEASAGSHLICLIRELTVPLPDCVQPYCVRRHTKGIWGQLGLFSAPLAPMLIWAPTTISTIVINHWWLLEQKNIVLYTKENGN